MFLALVSKVTNFIAEDCDCGPDESECPCCDPITCKYKPGAECVYGGVKQRKFPWIILAWQTRAAKVYGGDNKRNSIFLYLDPLTNKNCDVCYNLQTTEFVVIFYSDIAGTKKDLAVWTVSFKPRAQFASQAAWTSVTFPIDALAPAPFASVCMGSLW